MQSLRCGNHVLYEIISIIMLENKDGFLFLHRVWEDLAQEAVLKDLVVDPLVKIIQLGLPP